MGGSFEIEQLQLNEGHEINGVPSTLLGAVDKGKCKP